MAVYTQSSKSIKKKKKNDYVYYTNINTKIIMYTKSRFIEIKFKT